MVIVVDGTPGFSTQPPTLTTRRTSPAAQVAARPDEDDHMLDDRDVPASASRSIRDASWSRVRGSS
jgi:hypothetical protein